MTTLKDAGLGSGKKITRVDIEKMFTGEQIAKARAKWDAETPEEQNRIIQNMWEYLWANQAGGKMNLEEIRERINPAYSECPGTESYERKWLVGEIDRLREIERLYNEAMNQKHVCEIVTFGSVAAGFWGDGGLPPAGTKLYTSPVPQQMDKSNDKR